MRGFIDEAARYFLKFHGVVGAEKCWRIFLAGTLLTMLLPFNAGAQSGAGKAGTWSGTLVSSSCNADEAFGENPDCAKEIEGSKLALYDDTNRVMYELEPQSAVKQHLGDSVSVHGTLEESTIEVASSELMSIGLAVGQKAPAFSLRDEFGQEQTLDSLRGANGTILLFFRSADW